MGKIKKRALALSFGVVTRKAYPLSRISRG